MEFSRLQTYDCAPTLTDEQVISMCANGFLMLEAVVPDEINQRVLSFLADKIAVPMEPTEILGEDWFVEQVILNPAVAGAIRSLLGADFHLPVLMSNHRFKCPAPITGGWHVDGASKWSPALDGLQVFYYPQDAPPAMGPTQVVPGSHLIRHAHRAMGHLGTIRGTVSTAAPAGSIFLTVYNIWHRRPAATGTGLRQMLKSP